MSNATHSEEQVVTPEEAHAEYVSALQKINEAKIRKCRLKRLTDMLNELNLTPNL